MAATGSAPGARLRLSATARRLADDVAAGEARVGETERAQRSQTGGQGDDLGKARVIDDRQHGSGRGVAARDRDPFIAQPPQASQDLAWQDLGDDDEALVEEELSLCAAVDLVAWEYRGEDKGRDEARECRDRTSRLDGSDGGVEATLTACAQAPERPSPR